MNEEGRKIAIDVLIARIANMKMLKQTSERYIAEYHDKIHDTKNEIELLDSQITALEEAIEKLEKP